MSRTPPFKKLKEGKRNLVKIKRGFLYTGLPVSLPIVWGSNPKVLTKTMSKGTTCLDEVRYRKVLRQRRDTFSPLLLVDEVF